MMDKIKLLLVEDDPVWLECLSAYLHAEPDFLLSGVATSKDQALQTIEQIDTDVLLLDMILTPPQHDGLELARSVLEKQPLKIIMLTSVEEAEWVGDAIFAGVLNYVIKAYYEDLPSAIRDAYNNRDSIHPFAKERLLQEFGRLKRMEGEHMLTRAEQDILQLIGKGHSRKQITQFLHVTENTVKSHIRHVIKKVGTRTGKEAAEKAQQKGWFQHHETKD